MTDKLNRRAALRCLAAGLPMAAGVAGSSSLLAADTALKTSWLTSTRKGLDWVARTQTRMGHWASQAYPTAMAALAGTALIASGSTTTQGPYAKNIRRVTDFIYSKRRDNGLIGDPLTDNRYTYGHGFSMLFLSQVLGEEEDEERREELISTLTKAVEFTVSAQTTSGGWGYVSAKDGNDFDEGSTTITQVQGLRGCRNAGIVVPSEVVERAKQYIYSCQNPDGGISYSSKNRGTSRPAITAASICCLQNAGEYGGDVVDKMINYCKDNLHQIQTQQQAFSHWHYTYLYYAQVVYREGFRDREFWEAFRDRLYTEIVRKQRSDGAWDDTTVGPIYVTSCNLIMMQLDYGFLPIYQR
ncbi:terpene cyclase/mutase family protein [Blastopirellula sp. JC732]|uniref:Terpene cyclase/mutase family protein n=1 Tax=Blastopirellula sediminis TaxID=2894196 RepID=A0A9X1MRU6_9BACT|nr:prenyltransferase/squalene oxidase repeat-containing protein [Blastopirellula sediminis]MCC9605221.1 terpene cyclase/mutase family protein [Blastopirellula sediminis]MCC9631479.1 terpene cyclase/mutase family protein [Blastopirellula sediminis]